jgi:lysophospholipase L1-like esterase
MSKEIGAWEQSIVRLKFKPEIVFMGDSITCESNFQKMFPEKDIMNIAVVGYSVRDMLSLVNAVWAASPKKVFIMGGINGLKTHNTTSTAETFRELTDKIRELIPNAEIYIESVLPVSESKEDYACPNTAIDEYNLYLKAIAEEKGYIYIDVNSSFKDERGKLKEEYSRDGIHLKPEAYKVWEEAIKEYI